MTLSASSWASPTIPRSFLLVAARARNFILQDLPDVELEAAEFRRCRQRHQVARARERHVDPAGMGGHHHGAVAQQQCFLDRMGDIDHGLACLLPDAHQLGLQVTRFWASSAARGSSISSMPGSVTKARAIALRWRMPPESWCG